MDIKKEDFNEKIKTCLQNEPSFCTAVCPFHLDIHDFIPKMQRGRFNAAYRTYLNAVVFPNIVSELCHEPCKKVCPRSSKDEAINMKLLEKASIKFARNLEPNSYNMPPKNKKVAIVGAGISGLSCALRLASKKYDVTVFEKSGRIGGHLWDLSEPEIFLNDIERQFKNEKYTLCLNKEVINLEELKEKYDAVYVATGKDGSNFGLKRNFNGAFASNTPGIFMGGMLCGKNIVESIADGIYAVNAIERYIKTGNMNQEEEKNDTKIKINADFITEVEPVMPSDDGTYTSENAVEEAKRCLRCSCDACIRHCDLMKYYGKYPKRIGEEVHITVHPGTLDGNGTVATRLISTCNQCGLCKDVCPERIDTGEYLLQSHREMREKGAMPWAFHDFWLRDMEFANGEKTALCKIPKGFDKSKYAFFPGCQLGASDYRYVIKSYEYLLKQNPDTAIMLNCCGAPAEWAGDEPIHRGVIETIRNCWLSTGKPTVIFACTTCRKMFNKYLPEISGIFLYELMEKGNINIDCANANEKASVFDPCTSRDEPALQNSVRALSSKGGFELEPLSHEGKYAKCCSWGGQVSVANPSYSKEVVKARLSQSINPYIAYCSNCRDIFALTGKNVYHILDIVFNLNDSNRKPPTFTERRKNRVLLKQKIIKDIFNEEIMEQKDSKTKLIIEEELKEKLSSEMILETEIEEVIEHCEREGKKVLDGGSGHFIGHLKIGTMTYWVEYDVCGDHCYTLYNAYAHRMSIEES
ncbi:NAD(P)-binding protein [Sedimentibacter hydroxybenzoicus DSM 7310]|uniref:NAD(P)-binding protein n=1 Tax=Sedimentibacter hydroxybenzoicus DSM 7310 TaxID=1123245 RepID=A0A974BHB6_SEDHY|nr:pyridine nucleotide-disulfide oxidoreductase/dicluster-binding protein [Sedimentibacter hydroxybenzoicus]NYB72695.1 NAD(P)-binding protein [Sedimentibacter hydroxybenzoicus DSM 7310]